VISNGIGFLIILIGILLKFVSETLTGFLFLVGFGSIVILTGIVLYTNSSISWIRTFVGMILIGSEFYLLYLVLLQGEFTSITIITISIASYLLFTFLVISIPLKIASRIGDIKGEDLIRGFLYAWADKNVNKIENVFENLSIERTVPIGLIRFKRLVDSEELLLIISTIHPGPFLNAGSSNMPFLVSKIFKEKYGCDALTLHSTCTHSENLPAQQEVYKLVEKLNSIREKISLRETKTILFQEKIGDLTLTWQAFNNFIVSIVSRSPKELDDLHLQIGNIFREILRSAGYDGMLIDAHNSLKNPGSLSVMMPEDNESQIILQRTREISNEIGKLQKYDFEVGWYNAKCSSLGAKDGLGPGGVWALVQRIHGKIFAYIILDSNNLYSGLREKILTKLISENMIDEGEVLTTDTHYVNAVSPKTGAYKLLNESTLDSLLPCITKAVEEAKKRLSPVKVGYSVEEIKVKMLGEDSVRKLLHAALAGGYAFQLLMVSMIALFSVILLLLSLF